MLVFFFFGRPQNAVYYRAEVIGRSDDFTRYTVKFAKEEQLELSQSDILLFPLLEMEFSGVCTSDVSVSVRETKTHMWISSVDASERKGNCAFARQSG